MPLLDKPVRGSRTARPVMVLLDLLGRRWTLRVLWELRGGALSFRDLQARCDAMSPSVLNQRLAELREALLVDASDAGYQLTPRGADLLSLFEPVTRWAETWGRALRDARPPKSGGRSLTPPPAPPVAPPSPSGAGEGHKPAATRRRSLGRK